MWQHTLQHRKCPSSILSADPEDEDVLVTNLNTSPQCLNMLSSAYIKAVLTMQARPVRIVYL